MATAVPAQLRARAALELRARKRHREARVAVPATYAEWLATARPEHRWDYPHFQAMQSVLDGATAGTIRRAYVSIPIRHGKSEHNTIGGGRRRPCRGRWRWPRLRQCRPHPY
jgi:hypothetical protein